MKMYMAVLDLQESNRYPTRMEVKEAYRTAAKQFHPDSVPVDDPSRSQREEHFKDINDAYQALLQAIELDEVLFGNK